MLRSNVPRAVRVLRRQRGWRQADLAARFGRSRETISRLERGDLRGLTIGTLEHVAGALGASVDLWLRWEGERLDRLVDAAHAALQKTVADTLGSIGWLVQVEVSFNHYGDRGRVDVLAFHPSARIVLCVEVKSALGDLQDTLGRLDVKARLGRTIAVQAGWREPRAVVPVLVIGDSRAARRIVTTHASLFGRYAVRGRAGAAWLRSPGLPYPSGLLWFAKMPNSREATARRARRVRIGTSTE
jgi:transcriptional regulator with XRE-family HTH domain